MEFQRNIVKTLTKAKLNDRDEAEILYERIVILEKENECLKNEARNQKQIIQTLLSDERKERWITVKKRNSEVENKVYERQTPAPVNLKNRFQKLEESSITDQHNDATLGSILGPLLFLIYIKDLSEGLSSNTKVFADDTSMSAVIHDGNTSAL